MKKNYKWILILLAAVFVVGGFVLVLKGEKDRELILADFKYGEEYQFGALDWNTPLEKVEDFLDCSLEIEPAMTPAPAGYAFYRFVDTTYVLDGNITNAFVEFYEDGLSMIEFYVKPENTNTFLEEIVVVCRENFGQETRFMENNGFVGYQWKTDKSMLQIDCSDSTIHISVGTLEIY
ncbi:MAG: hypothetical protein E7286_08485 [Lachnospiraceae bacterium]|nr:hypothetical protein [Lachnospiraceae bacterium]